VPDAVRPAELEALIALIVGEQRRSDRMIPTLGDEPDGVRAELLALDPSWVETARVVRDGDGRLVGAVLVELDAELGQAWILGPWVAGDDEAWARYAGSLVEASLAQVPATFTGRTLTGHTDNIRLAQLAGQLGWRPGPVSHVLMADRPLIDGWPDDGATDELRLATADDFAAVDVLHEAEFPGTYATAGQLLRGSEVDDGPVVLVAEGDGVGVVGYAAGRIHPDGEGYIDFLAVSPSCRRTGLGRRLVIALARQLIVRAPQGRVCLSVRDERTAARALYAELGFRTLLSMVGYRAGPEDGSGGSRA
jgi:ribosomal protein S18 acetylase RimI-like enzyme